MRRIVHGLVPAMLLAGNSSAFACELGTTKRAKLRTVSGVCNRTDAPASQPITTGDAIAVKILPLEAGVEFSGISLARADGFKGSALPELRKLADGSYFTNLAFASSGEWIISLTVVGRKDPERISLPVSLAPEQAKEIVSNTAPVPAFSLQDPNGKTITRDTLKGKVWVANFFFASCPEACPLMSQKLAGLQKQFPDKDFHIVSVTTDPETDTPVILKEFGQRYQADARWHFLRGAKSAAVALSEGGLGLDVKDESRMHSLKFALVGRDGKVLGRYDSTKVEELEELKVELKDLLRNGKPGPAE
jgi:protein SCO1/2